MRHPIVLCLLIIIFFPGICTAACGIPGRPANGFLVGFTEQERYEEGVSFKYDCMKEHYLFPASNETRTCINGSWTGEMSICIDNLCFNPGACLLEKPEKSKFFSTDSLPEVKKPEYFEIKMNKQYHVSFVSIAFLPSGSTRCKLTHEEYKHHFNVCVSNNSSTRFLSYTGRNIWHRAEPNSRYCNYYYRMEDKGSPLADTINIEVKNSPVEKLNTYWITVYGIEYDNDCGQPDSPLHSVFTYNRLNRTLFYKCKQGYQAVGDRFVSRCADDLKWTSLDMKCIKNIEGFKASSDIALAGILALPLGLLVCVLSLILGKILHRRRKKRREQQDLIKELRRLKENRQLAVYFDDPLDDQSDLFSIARRWEFPKDRLELGKCLGEGAFGTVVKAEATGLIEGESTTTVAVKMVKCRGNNEHLEALLSELKILAYVGHHMNIVNLLGTVSKNLTKGELMVITEYCEFGNMRNFLLSHRDRFINELDPETGALTTNIEVVQTPGIAVGEEQHRTSCDKSERNLMYGKFRCSLDECRQKILSIPPISTRDLVSYAFQCARGMEFLSSKKLVHRDLAARNVLLAKDKIVKICDFGLSRKTYEEYIYLRKGKGPLPIKWMAIESICDRAFTVKSDVWSYGVLLWEIFTLGADPYPGAECNEEFYKKLKGGYRMEKPELAPNAVYTLMQQTWQENPKDRPTFTEIAEMFGNLLEETVRSYYLDLNVPHVQFNEPMEQGTQSDPTMVSDICGIGNWQGENFITSETTEPDVKADVEDQFTMNSLDESKSATASRCETTKL